MAVQHSESKRLGLYVFRPGELREADQSGTTLLLGSTSRRVEEELFDVKTYLRAQYSLVLPPRCLLEDVWVVMAVLRRSNTSRKVYTPTVLVVQNGTPFTDIRRRDLVYSSGPFADEDEAAEVAEAILETAVGRFLLIPTNSLENIAPPERKRFTHLALPKKIRSST